VTGIAIVITMYIGVQVFAQGVLGPALAGNPAPLAAIADVIYQGAGALIVLTATVSLVGFLQGDVLGNSRLVFAMASNGFLPALLAKVSAKHRSPTAALIAHATLAWVMATAGSFKTLALLSGGTMCLVYMTCCGAAWQLQRTNAGENARPFRLACGPAIPAIGILGMAFIVATLQRAEWIAMGCTALAVSGLYLLARRNAPR
jgi:amino acid transporter